MTLPLEILTPQTVSTPQQELLSWVGIELIIHFTSFSHKQADLMIKSSPAGRTNDDGLNVPLFALRDLAEGHQGPAVQLVVTRQPS